MRLIETLTRRCAIAAALVWAICLSVQAADTIPSEYNRATYIESHNNEWIDTKFLVTRETKIVARYSLSAAIVNGDKQRYVFGCYASDNKGGRCQYSLKPGGEAMTSFGGKDNYKTDTTGFDHMPGRIFTVTMDRGTYTCEACSRTPAATYPNGAGDVGTFNTSLYIFGLHPGSNAVSEDSRSTDLRIYSFKLWDGDNLVFDMVPVMRKSDGKYGLLNVAKNDFTFFGNANTTGAFTGALGPEIVPLTADEVSDLGGATGGDSRYSFLNGDGSREVVHVFRTPGAATFTIPAANAIRAKSGSVLVIGGGGAGGGNCGGGGGAGGFFEKSGINLLGGDYALTVGKGGTGAMNKTGGNGENSTLTLGDTTYTALGGGGGGSWSGTDANGVNGGCGGGGSTKSGAPGKSGAGLQPTSETGGYGFGGGEINASTYGGGGGAGGVGGTATGAAGGAGGIGRVSAITGEEVYYAGGGGGSTSSTTVSGGAGSRGGGGGGASGKNGDAYGVQGSNGLGGGGGGGSGGNYGGAGGAGGNGVVIVRYTLEKTIQTVTYANATEKSVDGQRVITFATGDGILNLMGPAKLRILAVGGGGAGGTEGSSDDYGAGGGGGAGGVVEKAEVLPAGAYAVIVGKGGAAATDLSASVAGGNGEDSKISGPVTIVALGGGGGGGLSSGRDGGCGGGGSKAKTATTGGAGSQGGAGGAGSKNYYGAGGGGAGADGAVSAKGAAGGDGISSDITGVSIYYAGGGGGGNTMNSTRAAGGLGGGGMGGNADDKVDPEPGVDGLGGGGGGGGYTPGAKGGDGTVIVRVIWSLSGPLEKPTSQNFEYDGYQKTLMEPNPGAYKIEGTASAKDAGDYSFTVTLVDPDVTWSDGTRNSVTVNWSIAKASNEIYGLEIADYREGEASYPDCRADWGFDTIVYTYTDINGVSSTELPKEVGDYTIRATIAETDNYEGAAAGPVAFKVLPGLPSPIKAFKKVIDVIADTYTDSEVLEDFVMLVKITAENAPGLYAIPYEDLGEQICFADEYGRQLAYDIDEWHTDGVSYIWVKVPQFVAKNKIYLFYELDPEAGFVKEDAGNAWTKWAGVWHMSETITAADAATAGSRDSTTNNVTATPYTGATAGDRSQMVSIAGMVGNGRANNKGAAVTHGNRLETAVYNIGNRFVYSGWFRMDERSGYPRLGGNKTGNDNANGWLIESVANQSDQFKARGANGSMTANAFTVNDLLNNWVYLAFVYDGGSVTAYSNGRNLGRQTVTAVNNGAGKLTIGGPGTYSESTLGGGYDEVRLGAFVPSAVWIKADYDQQARGGIAPVGTPRSPEGLVFQRYWKVEPAIAPASLDLGQDPEVYERGESDNGIVPVAVFVNLDTGVVTTNAFPKLPGAYEATFTIEAMGDYTGLTKKISFEIVANRWVREPSFGPTRWDVGETVELAIDRGADIRGDVDDARGATAYIEYYDYSTGATQTNTVPTGASSYRARFIVEPVEVDGLVYGRLEYDIDFQIADHSPYSELDSSLGRVLLMNRDKNTTCPIDRQSWDCVSKTQITWWERLADDSGADFNLLGGTEFKLRTKGADGRTLWHLVDCRQGNTFPYWSDKNQDMKNAQVYLPWSSTAYACDDRTSGNIEQYGSAWCVMQNKTDAAVYSSCFEDGIGTIYFDAANGWTTKEGTATADPDACNYRIVVEIATNCVNSQGQILLDPETGLPKAPTDANVYEVIPGFWQEFTDAETGIVTSNFVAAVTNEYGFANWQPLSLNVLKRDYPADWEGEMPFEPLTYGSEAVSNEFIQTDASCKNICLDIRNGGTLNNFYRIYIPLNYHGPARFRIRRETCFPSNIWGPDDGGMILLDNIIVSYPQMRADLESLGIFDAEKAGKQTLGQEAAWNTPFPAYDDAVFARANPIYYTNAGNTNIDVSTFVVASTLNYRWRYLDQTMTPWKKVSLSPENGFNAFEPLDLPGKVGDVEYYFTTVLNAPFYDYVDYSGTGLRLGGFYTEELASVTNRAPATREVQPSQGTDWFVRLREGKSDYEAIDVEIKCLDGYGEEYGATTVEMELIDDHVWRGYYKTLNGAPGGLRYRFAARNLQTPGDRTWRENTSYWHSRDDIESLPASVMLTDGEEWASVPSDAATGYLLFQVDDSTRSLTIVHADYQNFNGWNDANVAGGRFVGTSTQTNKMTGVSAKAVECRESFDGWRDMPKTNAFWTETFTTSVQQEYPDYTSFMSTTTPNGMSAGPGMWVYGFYKDDTTGRALQMEGQGHGYVQFVDAVESPRGLESISFRARLGQFVNFDNFSYYDAPVKTALTNYIFGARVAFDTNSGKNFGGNASVSLIARYRPKVGCYEARLEQIGAKFDKQTHKVVGPCNGWGPDITGTDVNGRRQCLSIRRWDTDPNTGRLTSTVLIGITNSWEMAMTMASGTDGSYQPMFISVTNTPNGVLVTAGILKGAGLTPAAVDTGYSSSVNGKNWWMVSACDPNSRLTCGTYGGLTANCPGVVLHPTVFDGAFGFSELGLANGVNSMTKPSGAITWYRKNIDRAMEFPGAGKYKSCFDELNSDLWVWEYGRTEPFVQSGNQFGLRGLVPTQPVNVYTADAGKMNWTLLASKNVNTFGTAAIAEKLTFPLYTTKDCSVRIASGGDSGDIRTDIIVDDIEFTQWRGNDWSDRDEMVTLVPNWTSEEDYKAHTNFIFTSGWIMGESLLMSAKRTAEGYPCSIRSPLFDGTYNRGVGLGMFSFAYSNAQNNVNLLVQVATNVMYDTVNNINNLDTNTWATVTNFNFSGCTASELKQGVRSCYIGLHGAQGVMRVIMDPAVVESVANVKDQNRFGEIYITEVLCRDEPVVDYGCWWGWNLRTLGADAQTGRDAEKRMYLPDLSGANHIEKRGLSLALNNSTTANVDPVDAETYRQHMPFLQTPTFVSNIVGEVTFRARKYDSNSGTQPAQVTLYGSITGDISSDWARLATFIVTNTTYTTYTFKTEPGEAYGAFRLGVSGVKDVIDAKMPNPSPEGYDEPVRVLIDEVLVSEAVRARVAFRNVGAFRSDLSGTGYVPNVPSAEEQPLCNESWGVECEIYAAQLPDEIDFSRNPLVKLYWFAGEEPWGFDVWRTNRLAKSAWLARATGTNLVYRSSYVTAPDAVIPMSTISGSVVQYGLEVIYYQVGAEKPLTNYLSAADWKTPSWYSPVDLNQDALHGAGVKYSAYNILDTVAPYWAWINEVNIYGEYDYNYDNTERDRQFVEVAVPQEADISGWSVRLLEAQTGTGRVITNVLATFGREYGEIEGTKPGLVGAEDNMVFRVLACPKATSTNRLKKDDGTLDGVWKVDYPTAVFSSGGEISAMDLVGIQLVRRSGIVEHEIVTRGFDWLGQFPEYADESLATNTVAYFDSHMKGAHFVYVGDDDGGVVNTRGVINERGRTTNVWTNAMQLTPGRKNEGQVIDPDHPTPNGSSVIVYANLNPLTPQIRQTVGDAVDTNANQMVIIPRGSLKGTNITYRVDPWYDIDVVTTNGKPASVRALAEKRAYEITVGVGASNNVTVVASAKVSDALQALGITDDNRYKPAVLDWLSKHKDAYGHDWADVDADEVKLADVIRYPDGTVVTNLTLTQMYWLDMDPTAGGLGLMPAVTYGPTPVVIPGGGSHGVNASTNVRMRVFAMITNRTDDVAATNAFGKKAWAPYVLRGLDPGVTSWDYTPDVEWGWTSVTFKVTGILANGLTSRYNRDNWIPLRWFVFTPDSFRPDDDPTAPFTSDVEIMDPYGKESPGYGAGWWSWVEEHGQSPIYYFWTIDTRLKPFTVETMKTENYYE